MTLDIDASIQEVLKKLQYNPDTYQIPKDSALDKQIIDSHEFTDHQAALLTTHKPFVIGTAGAGCGKTHTLVGRLKYLNALGIKPQEIMNLSFSNAAVDNLKERFPEAEVSTIASLCQEMYKANFNQNVQFDFYPATFMNSVNCTYINANATYTDQHAFPKQMVNVDGHEVLQAKAKLYHAYRKHFIVDYNNRTSVKEFTSELFDLVEAHFNALNILLKHVRQIEPSLSEIMIQYTLAHEPQNFSWPDQLQGIKVLTLDECQDTSTIEMLLMLQIVKALNAQLFLVGDANQTLFEWRSADPEMIGILQRHPAFTSYNLDTNFRSKQAILMYANVILKRLSTNQTNPIALHDLDNSDVSIDEFKAANSISVNNGFMDKDTFDWIESCIDNGEQVAILGQSHRDIDSLTDVLSFNLDRDFTIMDMSSASERPTDLISATMNAVRPFIGQFSQQYYGENFDTAFYTFLTNYIYSHDIPTMQPRYDNNEVLEVLSKGFTNTLEDDFVKQQLQEYYDGNKKTYQIADLMVHRLLIEEINMNDAIQEEQRKLNEEKQNLDLNQFEVVTSTIHSAKGLEFDHVLVIYNETSFHNSRGADQGQLRALGVALTRAKLSQHILEISNDAVHKNDLETLATYEDFSKRPLVTGYQLFMHYMTHHDPEEPNKNDANFIDKMKHRRPLPFIV